MAKRRGGILTDLHRTFCDNDTGSGHPVVLYYKIHNICSYSQTQLSIMPLIKSTHFATGFDQT